MRQLWISNDSLQENIYSTLTLRRVLEVAENLVSMLITEV